MAVKGAKVDGTRGKKAATVVETPDDFPPDLGGEFNELPEQLLTNLSTVIGLAMRNGGYFGLSITDDFGSCRLAIRSGAFSLDKRLYSVRNLEQAVTWCYNKLRSTTSV